MQPYQPSRMQFASIFDLKAPILFASGEIEDCFRKFAIVIPYDIISSAFFFLSRWEEATIQERDQFGRFPYKRSLFAQREKCLKVEVPIVNQYLEIFRLALNQALQKKGRQPIQYPKWLDGKDFAVALTHDVDSMRKWTPRGYIASIIRLAKSVLGSRSRQTSGNISGMQELAALWESFGKIDPHWSFSEIIATEQQYNFSSTFFIKGHHKHPQDGRYAKLYQRHRPSLLRILKRSGVEIGVHGGYYSSQDIQSLKSEKSIIEHLAQRKVKGNRFHTLRMEYHQTLLLLEKAGFVYDTTLGFAEMPGFRSGFSFPHQPYNIYEDRPFNLIELPLIIMDTTLLAERYCNLKAEAAWDKVFQLMKTLQRTQGGAAVLWHNDTYDRFLAPGYAEMYSKLLNWVYDNGGCGTSAGALIKDWQSRRNKKVFL
jgi:peptidoglycan/xylan/chitin deacetylase (PgdA/CDA1 family)